MVQISYNPLKSTEYRINSIRDNIINYIERREKLLKERIKEYNVGEMNHYAIEKQLDEIDRLHREVESQFKLDKEFHQ